MRSTRIIIFIIISMIILGIALFITKKREYLYRSAQTMEKIYSAERDNISMKKQNSSNAKNLHAYFKESVFFSKSIHNSSITIRFNNIDIKNLSTFRSNIEHDRKINIIDVKKQQSGGIYDNRDSKLNENNATERTTMQRVGEYEIFANLGKTDSEIVFDQNSSNLNVPRSLKKIVILAENGSLNIKKQTFETNKSLDIRLYALKQEGAKYSVATSYEDRNDHKYQNINRHTSQLSDYETIHIISNKTKIDYLNEKISLSHAVLRNELSTIKADAGILDIRESQLTLDGSVKIEIF